MKWVKLTVFLLVLAVVLIAYLILKTETVTRSARVHLLANLV